jgi:hypothetical protein
LGFVAAFAVVGLLLSASIWAFIVLLEGVG